MGSQEYKHQILIVEDVPTDVYDFISGVENCCYGKPYCVDVASTLEMAVEKLKLSNAMLILDYCFSKMNAFEFVVAHEEMKFFAQKGFHSPFIETPILVYSGGDLEHIRTQFRNYFTNYRRIEVFGRPTRRSGNLELLVSRVRNILYEKFRY